MTDPEQSQVFPYSVRRLFMLGGTLLAAGLYAMVLGSAMLVTLTTQEAVTFNPNMLRAASLLSGLVGSIVTAGFARSAPAETVHLSTEHAMGGHTLSNWKGLKPPSLLQRNLIGLADTIGVSISPPVAPPPDAPLERVQEPNAVSSATWVALVYLGIYVIVGLAAFLVSMLRANSPEVVSQAGWVWLGTIVSSAYSFFGLDNGA